MKVEYRINHQIRVRQVRLVDEAGAQLGVVATDQALRLARERGCDLVEVASTANPPVCRLMDYGKFKYELKKKNRQTGKKAHTQSTKEIRLRPLTGQHDVDFKVRHAREFIAEGDKVLITVVFRGREMAHQEIGRTMMLKIRQQMEDLAKVEREPRMEGNRLSMMFMPKGKGEGHAKAKDKQVGQKAVQSDRAGQSPVPPAGQEPPAVGQVGQTQTPSA